jgi:hypothetical protein
MAALTNALHGTRCNVNRVFRDDEDLDSKQSVKSDGSWEDAQFGM